MYLTFYPDLAVPDAAPAVGRFMDHAVGAGIEKVVLLSGRGEPQCQPSERAVQASGIRYTIVRSAFFDQNFSEGQWLGSLLDGDVPFFVGDVGEPFIDLDDLADVVVEALTNDEHSGRTYELTGPRLLTFPDAVRAIREASGRTIRYTPVTKDEYATMLARELPPDVVTFLCGLFAHVLDGHNSHLSGDVERVLGRPPRDFVDWARETARSGVWRA